MKIVKEMGEQPSPRLHRRIGAELRPILAVTGTGTALWAGSRTLISRSWNLFGQHLHGWERHAALGFGTYVTGYAAVQAPHIARFAVPASAVAWCVAAWCVAPPPDHEPEAEQIEEELDGLALDDLAAAVRRVAGPRQGAHLADLLTQPEIEGWTQPELKAAVLDLGVPVDEFKLILAGRQRVRDGVRVRDLPSPPDPAPAIPPPPNAPSSPAPLPAAAATRSPQ